MVMKERGISRLVGGSFNKQGNFQMRLVLDKMWTFPHLPCRILKVYPEAVNRVQACMPSTWSLPHITLSRMHPENDPRVGTDCLLPGQRRGEEPSIAWVQLQGQTAVTSSHDPLQQAPTWVCLLQSPCS